MFISTPHNNVLALDAGTGKLKWQFAYNPPVILYPVSRGLGVADGKVLMGTLDCRVIALDPATGKEQWNVPGCHDDNNSWFSMASYVYKGNVILGTAGGDNGSQGYVSAFRLADGPATRGSTAAPPCGPRTTACRRPATGRSRSRPRTRPSLPR